MSNKRRSAVLMALATLFAGGIAAFGASPAAAAPCVNGREQVVHYGYVGYKICGTHEGDHNHSASNTEYFVIGTNHQIYHTWYNAGGWFSLGGNAPDKSPFGTPNGVWANGTGNNFHIMTYGTDGDDWCRNYLPAYWKEGWKRCLP